VLLGLAEVGETYDTPIGNEISFAQTWSHRDSLKSRGRILRQHWFYILRGTTSSVCIRPQGLTPSMEGGIMDPVWNMQDLISWGLVDTCHT